MKSSHNKSSVFRNICEQPYNEHVRVKLYNSTKGNVDFVQRLALQRSLPVHNGCVNCICWNDTGEYLLSGSDDQHLVVSHAYNYKIRTNYKTSHRANIFSAKFLPGSGDKNIVSCSGDGMILFTDLFRPTETHNNRFTCHRGTTYEIATVPNEPHTFLSCGEDNSVRCFDLRIKEKCERDNCNEDVLISCQRAVTALSINSVRPYQMAIGCADSTVRIFDRRMLGTIAAGFLTVGGKGPRPFAAFTAPGMEDRSYRITSLGFSPQGEDVLVSYSSEHLYLFSIKDEACMEFEPEMSSGEDEEEGEVSSKPVSGLPPVRRLRLRGDWSDTGPDARPERDGVLSTDSAQARPTLHATLMQRMTDVLSRMLNDPATRAALSHGGEDVHNEYAEDNPSRDRPEDVQGPRSPGVLVEESPTLTFSVDGIFPNTIPQQEVESPNIVTESSQVRWSPSVASPTQTPAEDPVSLPSFESSFVGVKPSPSSPPSVATVIPFTGSIATTDTSTVSVATVLPPTDSFATPETSTASDATVLPSSVSVATPVTSTVSDAAVFPSSVSFATPDTSTVSVATPETSTVSTSDTAAVPSTSSGPPASGSSSSTSQDSLTSLTVQQLNNMRHNFIDRHGTEPVVNLTYSDKGSTASRISLALGDEVNRETVPQPQEELAGPSLPEEPISNTSSGPSVGTNWAEPMLEGDFIGRYSSSDSDEDMESPPAFNIRMRRPNASRSQSQHSIVSVMEEAIKKNAQSKRSNPLDDRVKVRRPFVKQKFTGHRNARTMIKEATFWGDEFVLSGSDCGHVFVWDRNSAKLKMLLEADHHVVNCIQPHPFLPLLATSGIDYDVKLWAPVLPEPRFDEEMAEELVKRNEVMLEETKDTITVPASFMIRMLACLNQIRRGARSRSRQQRNDNSDPAPE